MKKLITISMLILTILVSACDLNGTPAPAPTQDISQTLDAVRTQAVETAVAEQAGQATAVIVTATLAETATELPSPTMVPSLTPADTLAPTPVPTSTPVISSGVVATAVPAAYDCSVSNVSPVYLAEFAPRGEMDGKWTVKNTGSKTWGAPDVDVMYVAGEKMYQYGDTYNLAEDVAPGESIDIVVDMLAPAEPGIYKTTWGLVYGSQAFCQFNLTIQVK